MLYRYNSSLKIKIEPCIYCGLKKPVFRRDQREPVCKECATIRDVQQATEAENTRMIQNEGLSDLVDRLDDIFSQWLRLSHADNYGKCECYTCGKKFYWTAMQAGHFIRRGNMLLRWDERNIKPQCERCNCHREEREMLAEFAKRLDKETPGVVAILKEEQYIVYKPARTDLNQMIVEYTIKFKKLKAA